jgi:hypothetical protein
MGSHSLSRSAHSAFTHHTANTTYYQQHNVVQHLRVSLIDGGHRLYWLGDERHRIQKRHDNEAQDAGDCNHHKAPDADFDIFSG